MISNYKKAYDLLKKELKKPNFDKERLKKQVEKLKQNLKDLMKTVKKSVE